MKHISTTMKTLYNTLLGLLLFAASAFGLWMLGKWLILQFGQFDWTVIPFGLGVSLIVAILGISWIANTINKVARNLIAKEQFATKRALYQICLREIVQDYGDMDADQLYEQLLLTADPKVIRAFQNWQKAILAPESSAALIQLERDRLIFAMRKDLGFSNQSLLLGNLEWTEKQDRTEEIIGKKL